MSETYVVIFLLADEAYAIPVARVQEIQGYHTHLAPRRVPDTPAFFEGIIDLRGQVIPVVDLRQQLGLGRLQPSRRTCHIIVDAGSEKIGMLVDAVLEVQRVSDQAFAPPPKSLRVAIERDYVRGVGRLSSKSAEQQEDRLVILLDVERLISGWIGLQSA